MGLNADAFTRGLLIGAHLATGGVLTSAFIRERCGVSKAQANRYMLAAEVTLRAEATVKPGRRVELALTKEPK